MKSFGVSARLCMVWYVWYEFAVMRRRKKKFGACIVAVLFICWQNLHTSTIKLPTKPNILRANFHTTSVLKCACIDLVSRKSTDVNDILHPASFRNVTKTTTNEIHATLNTVRFVAKFVHAQRSDGLENEPFFHWIEKRMSPEQWR